MAKIIVCIKCGGERYKEEGPCPCETLLIEPPGTVSVPKAKYPENMTGVQQFMKLLGERARMATRLFGLRLRLTSEVEESSKSDEILSDNRKHYRDGYIAGLEFADRKLRDLMSEEHEG